ncbi:MAG: hypothetical protein CFE43_21545 [Burkholderiales bacterium PBB3]|nr:MAG: hypothetical protein CFE43_21545 [Burkholderiales bacterium PBB3]
MFGISTGDLNPVYNVPMLGTHKPRHPTTTSRPVSMISRNPAVDGLYVGQKKMKTISILMIAAIVGGLAVAQDNAKNSFPLAVTLSMPDRVGEWQEISFSYNAYLNTTANTLNVETPDQGRGFAGNIAYLLDPSGRTNSYGEKWVDPKEYPVTWGDYFHKLAPGDSLKKQDINMSSFFGKLSPGAYRLTILVPSDRYRIPGVISQRLESKPIQFEVLNYSINAERIVNAARKPTEDIFLRVDKPDAMKKEIKGRYTAQFVNNTKAAVEITTLDGILPCDVAHLTADADWDWKPFVLACGEVQKNKLTIMPAMESQVQFDIPRARGIYRVRIELQNGIKVMSDPIVVE